MLDEKSWSTSSIAIHSKSAGLIQPCLYGPGVVHWGTVILDKKALLQTLYISRCVHKTVSVLQGSALCLLPPHPVFVCRTLLACEATHALGRSLSDVRPIREEHVGGVTGVPCVLANRNAAGAGFGPLHDVTGCLVSARRVDECSFVLI